MVVVEVLRKSGYWINPRIANLYGIEVRQVGRLIFLKNPLPRVEIGFRTIGHIGDIVIATVQFIGIDNSGALRVIQVREGAANREWQYLLAVGLGKRIVPHWVVLSIKSMPTY